jgi:hypothetical protein
MTSDCPPDPATPSDAQLVDAVRSALTEGLHAAVDAAIPNLMTDVLLALLDVAPAQSSGASNS